MNNTAIIIGSTGLVGNHVLKLLLGDPFFSKIIAFSRKPIPLSHTKLSQHIVDFDKISDWADKIQGDVLFSCLGTTIKKAKTKDNQYKVDFTYQYKIALAAKENKVKSIVLISAGGANANSKIFYNRIKGELDETVKKINFNSTTIIKPSLLLGKRNEFRLAECMGSFLGKIVAYLPGLKKFRPIQASRVAKAMILEYKKNNHFTELKYSEIFDTIK